MKAPTLITPELLRTMPLPCQDEGGDKESRGRVLVVGAVECLSTSRDLLHALAGEGLALKVGPLGFLARELPAEIPPLLAQLSKGSE